MIIRLITIITYSPGRPTKMMHPKAIRSEYPRLLFTVALAGLLLTSNASAALSATDRCAQALTMMGVDTSGTQRGWAALCAGVIKNEPITRYGNWYGPGYWGGGEDEHKAGFKPPLDSLDAVAMRHDYGYVIAEKYGKIYGKKYEYKLKAMADKIAVNESMALPKDPRKWDKPPADINKAARYRDRIITGFIIESDLYKDLSTATRVGDTITSPFITWFDKIDYNQIPDLDKFKREVASHIRGWEKDLARKKQQEAREKKRAEKKKAEAARKKAAADKKRLDAEMQALFGKTPKTKRSDDEAKKAREAREARKRLAKKIAESKREKKGYDEMTPQERREALKANDDDAWLAIERELKGYAAPPAQEPRQPQTNTNSEIPPVRVKATGSIDEDYSANGFNNIVTTRFTLSFWNVGSQVPGYGGASMKSRSVSSLNGSSSETSCSGTFSGGPNGAVRLHGDCDCMVMAVRNGSSIDMGDTSLTISNPAAFSYWRR